MKRNPPWVIGFALCVTGAAQSFVAAAQGVADSNGIEDPAATASEWRASGGGARLGVSRITPDQARAFYRARGFSPDAAGYFAAACVFQLVLRNDAGGTLRYRLGDWRIRAGTATGRFVPVGTWEREWVRRGVSEPARIAFHWAQFPPEQEFEPGDWIMGMAALAPRPAGSFDLDYEWSIDGISHRGALSSLKCADAD